VNSHVPSFATIADSYSDSCYSSRFSDFVQQAILYSPPNITSWFLPKDEEKIDDEFELTSVTLFLFSSLSGLPVTDGDSWLASDFIHKYLVAKTTQWSKNPHYPSTSCISTILLQPPIFFLFHLGLSFLILAFDHLIYLLQLERVILRHVGTTAKVSALARSEPNKWSDEPLAGLSTTAPSCQPRWENYQCSCFRPVAFMYHLWSSVAFIDSFVFLLQ